MNEDKKINRDEKNQLAEEKRRAKEARAQEKRDAKQHKLKQRELEKQEKIKQKAEAKEKKQRAKLQQQQAKQEQARQLKENREREKAEQARLKQEKIDQAKAQKLQQQQAKQEQARQLKENQEREKAERVRFKQEKKAQAQAQKLQQQQAKEEQARLLKEKREHEKAEKIRLKQEKQTQKQQAKEDQKRFEKEKKEHDKAEAARLKREKVEQEKAAVIRAKQEKEEAIRQEKENRKAEKLRQLNLRQEQRDQARQRKAEQKQERKNKRRERINWLKNIGERISDLSSFTMAIRAWKGTKEIVVSILVASLFINALSLVFPLTLLQIYDRIIPNEAVVTLILLVVGVFVAIILAAILRVARSYIGAWADAKFEHIIGCQAFDRVMECDISEYEKEGSGRHLKRISALNMLRDFYAGQAIISLIDVPFVAIFLLLIGYIGGLLVLVPIVMIFVVILSTFIHSGRLQKLLKNRQDHDDRRLNFIVETISKIHTIKSNTMEAQMLRRYERLQKSSALYDYKVTQRGAYMTSESMTLSQVTLILVVAFGATMVFGGGLTVGGLAACTLLSGRVLQPVNTVISVWNRLQIIKIARAEFEKVLEMKPESASNLELLDSCEGSIRFENVSFRYNDDQDYIFENLNLEIAANETVSIQGEGLSGKSTLMWMLMRMLTPTSGKIFIDDRDLTTIDPESLRRQIGFMPQNANFLQGTIIENITMFDESLHDDGVALAEQLGLAEIVDQLPDGYDTRVGHQAAETLPRGVKQRIIIARSLIRKPKIVIFDEANITLDMLGDQKLHDLLESIQSKHTIIIVSHRPSFVSLASQHYKIESKQLRLAR